MTIRERVEGFVSGVRKRLGELVPNYVGTFDPLFRILAGWFGEEYHNIEREVAGEIEPLRGEIDHAMTSFAPEAEKSYTEVHRGALATLRARIKDALTTHWRDEQDRQDRLQDLAAEALRLDREVRGQNVSFNGSEDYFHVPAKLSKAQIVFEIMLVVAAVLAVMGLEWLAGYGVWRWAADPNIALGLTLITVFGFTILVRLTAVHLKRYLGHRDALRRFKRNYPGGHPEGFRVYPLPAGDRMIAIAGLSVFTVASLLLLGSRIWIVLTSPTPDFGNLAATVGLFFIILVYGLVEFAIMPPFTKGQIERIRSLRKKLSDVETELLKLRTPVPPEKHPLRLAVQKLFGEYNSTMDAEEARIANERDKLEGGKNRLLELFANCDDAWARLRAGYADSVNLLIIRVVREWDLDPSSLPFGSEAEDSRVDRIFTRGSGRNLYDPDFMQGLRNLRFHVDLPSIRITDVGALLQEVMRGSAVRLVGGATPQQEERR